MRFILSGKISEREVEQHLRIADKLKIDVYEKDFILRKELEAFNNLEGLFKFRFASELLKFIEEEIMSYKAFTDDIILTKILQTDIKILAQEFINDKFKSNDDKHMIITKLFQEIIQDILKQFIEQGKLYKTSDDEFYVNSF